MADYNDTPNVDLERAERHAAIKEEILFGGQENPPLAELEVIFDSRLGFAEKVEKLQVLRQAPTIDREAAEFLSTIPAEERKAFQAFLAIFDFDEELTTAVEALQRAGAN